MSIVKPDQLLNVPQLVVARDAPTRLTSELLHLANVVWHEPGIILPWNNLATSHIQNVEHRARTGVKLAVKQTIICPENSTVTRSGRQEDTEVTTPRPKGQGFW